MDSENTTNDLALMGNDDHQSTSLLVQANGPINHEQRIQVDASDSPSALSQKRQLALEKLQSTVASLAEFEGKESVRLVPTMKEEEVHRDGTTTATIDINSLVFFVRNSAPILVVVESDRRVNVRKLERYLGSDDDDERILVQLAPADAIESVCGFPPGCVPPLAHSPNNLRTIVDAKLVELLATDDDDNDGSTSILQLCGGGGLPMQTCLIRLDTLLRIEGTEVGDVSMGPVQDLPTTETVLSPKVASSQVSRSSDTGINGDESSHHEKPYFPYTPPPTDIAQQCYDDKSATNPLKPIPVTIVGRISGIRRMAKRLVFVDLAPPEYVGHGTRDDQYNLPWRSGTDQQDMAVQLIVGKTLCRNLGEVDGPATMRRFKLGQLLLVYAKTNVGNRNSLGNWVQKRSFDLVVWDVTFLKDTEHGPETSSSTNGGRHRPNPQSKSDSIMIKQEKSTSHQPKSSSELRRLQLAAALPAIGSSSNFLRLTDVLTTTASNDLIVFVDNLEAIHNFSNELNAACTKVENDSEDIPDGLNKVVVTGLDCEWKPSFMLPSPFEPQPILLLQICLAPLEKVFLLDLQALLRPLISPEEDMNDTERALSDALSILLNSKSFLKVGFQLMTDLCKLAGSFPHISAFRNVQGVLELTTVSRKAIQLAKIRNAKQLTASLARLSEFLLEKPLSKEQQVSDWSFRPLTPEQKEYAALDAAVTPALLRKALALVNASWMTDRFCIGRDSDDSAFARSTFSTRFLFLNSTDPMAIKKLKAKRIIGSQYIVTQQWITGEDPPQRPSAPMEGGGENPFRDVGGVLRIPASIVSVEEEQVQSLTGLSIGKAKERCLDRLIEGNPSFASRDEAKLDFQGRAGYVQFANMVAVFVNMPDNTSETRRRAYPNEWIDQGRYLSWFLRESEWQNGTSSLAKKMINENNDGGLNPVLFARIGKKEILCCGRCRVTLPPTDEKERPPSNEWDLVELHLELLDWEILMNHSEEFSASVQSSEEQMARDEPDEWPIAADHGFSDTAFLVQLVLNGDLISAMYKATKDTSAEKRTIHHGLRELKQRLTAETGTVREAETQRAIMIIQEKIEQIHIES